MKVMSTWIFVVLTEYYHIGSQQERLDNKEDVEEARPNQMRMWSSLGRLKHNVTHTSRII